MKQKLFNVISYTFALVAVLSAGTASAFWLHNPKVPTELLK